MLGRLAAPIALYILERYFALIAFQRKFCLADFVGCPLEIMFQNQSP